MADQEPIKRRLVRSPASHLWRILRVLAAAFTGRSRLWSWVWEREFQSLIRDSRRSEESEADHA